MFYRKYWKGYCYLEVKVFWGFLIFKMMCLLIKQPQNETLDKWRRKGSLK